MDDLLQPIKNVQIVDREKLKANDYNPNKVLKSNLELLMRSIENNGWTMPIAVREDFTIIDGFHRWMVSGMEPLKSKLGGKVPVVVVSHEDERDAVYGTITHNRARGQHLLGPMEKIIQKLIKSGTPIDEIKDQLGMREEEIWRLSGLTREDFLEIMVGDDTVYSMSYSRAPALSSEKSKNYRRKGE
ncbi:MAG: transcriptional regulator [Candidatus Aegiribacteria sp.]|nr:transcriptional regulator [Candidatus Aegiribacteria sp.]